MSNAAKILRLDRDFGFEAFDPFRNGAWKLGGTSCAYGRLGCDSLPDDVSFNDLEKDETIVLSFECPDGKVREFKREWASEDEIGYESEDHWALEIYYSN